MASGHIDSLQAISVKLVGHNYIYWAYVMKNFLLGKNMWDYITREEAAPTDTKAANHAELQKTWNVNNAKIITWINNSVDQTIGVQLAKFNTAKQIWEYLSKLYVQSNFAKRYQLEADIRAARQEDRSIQEFYSVMTGFWDQLALTEPAGLSAHEPYLTYREEQRLVQFFMALRDDFEGLRGSILHRSPLPSVDSVVNELLAEEVRFKVLPGKGLLPLPTQTVLAVPPKPPASSQARPRPRVGVDECSLCHEKGHWKAQCPKLMNKARGP
uniref:Retrotransposon Copia-like N-terminal domain-containing protein n=1 Tax=Davidia involucrata TaxID=16924 RepID=A0A5B7BTX9_DAVIN